MRSKRFAASIAVLGSALLAACAAGPPAPEITVRDDAFRPYREYTTGQRTVGGYPNTVITKLVARVDRKTGATTTLLGIGLVYAAQHMRNYESARNARAEVLPLQRISRHRSCEQRSCVYDEKFMIEIPADALRRAPSGGYPLKVFARDGGDATISVAKADIERLFAALDKPLPQAATPTN